MVGIIATGAYVPRIRLQRQAVAQAHACLITSAPMCSACHVRTRPNVSVTVDPGPPACRRDKGGGGRGRAPGTPVHRPGGSFACTIF
jgi:hypothetical protein